MGDRGMRSPSAAAQQEAAMASALFDHFCTAPTLKLALGYHRNLCDTLHLKPTRFPDYYPKLKVKIKLYIYFSIKIIIQRIRFLYLFCINTLS